MRLKELQQQFQEDLLGRESAIAAAVVDAPPLPVQARLDIYRSAYRLRLTEALVDVYSILHQLLGDETFDSLCELFIDAHPSEHRSIRWYGGELSDFLARQPPFHEQPVLAEIARFEWTLAEVFDAPDAAALDRGALTSLPPVAWADLEFRFHPTVRRLVLSWNSVAAWQAVSAGELAPTPERATQPVHWLIWRKDLQNLFRSLDAAECAALDAAYAGATFGEICEALTSFIAEDEVPLRAATLVAGWLDSGLVIGVETD